MSRAMAGRLPHKESTVRYPKDWVYIGTVAKLLSSFTLRNPKNGAVLVMFDRMTTSTDLSVQSLLSLELIQHSFDVFLGKV
jgi:hypothetical protein